ncbi:exodeoxyribonuclease V subunit alpha [Halomonas sp. PAR7]|nr:MULTISPECIES: exodeoxyribonuclease V subunit alpha [unclassified Halomonas]MDT0501432.1 exodeoxyribonuclease V subunit alpha [Halomonas sp. PAR7]MDT0512894.1 exodeoxyribonuclease V subunit alpha [Halomonas sp. LES1]MDT0591281.1 exodeoxyribonuclease V subunit alpha [Halomonas sp. PAR8]
MSDFSPTAEALHDTAALFALLDRWVDRGWLRALDRAFAAFLAREVADTPTPLLLAAALASHQLGRGHVCLDLTQTLAEPDLALSLPPEGDSLEDPPPRPSQLLTELSLADWLTALAHPTIIGDGPGSTPLVLEGTRLYLRRYWHHERSIQQHIAARLEGDAGGGTDHAHHAAETSTLSQALAALFPSSDTLDWQKAACALAIRSPFAVITGGPGTGKTTTVVKLLTLLQALALSEGQRPLRIRLAAPTGKAAARLNESIAGQVSSLGLDGLATLWEPNLSATHQSSQDNSERLRQAVPTEVTTLHRLLGSRPDTRHFRHNARNPLPLDVLVVDEASMVDVEMMAALLDALPRRARLVLLGDKDQLASVEAGSVLGDLCARAEGGHYTPATADWLSEATGQVLPTEMLDPAGAPLDQAIAMLRVSHRFDAESGIGQLAGAVNRDPVKRAPVRRDPVNRDVPGRQKRADIRRVLEHGYADLSHLKLDTDHDRRLERLVVSGHAEGFPGAGEGRRLRGQPLPPPVGYRHYLETMKDTAPPAETNGEIDRETLDDWARAVLAAHGQFQLLCALRRGPWGVEGLNERIRTALEKEGLIDTGNGRRLWYPGRPVLVTRNDYGLGLMNGDIGITLALPRPRAPSEGPVRGVQALRVAFPAGDGSGRIKWVLPSRLQAVETVYAMTVHKSQGSEFTHTALLLPDAPNPILTRELVYTGITRARHWLSLVETGRGQLLDAVERRVMRVSGLGAPGKT